MKNKELKELFPVVVIDTETTGFSSFKDSLIEIAAVRFIAGEQKETFSTFVNPMKPLPTFIKQLTHITDDDVATAPTPRIALRKLHEFLNPEDVIVCHNAPFDLGFINEKSKTFSYSKLTNYYLDTVELSRIFFPQLKSHNLETMTKFFAIELEAHRAINDAIATGRLFYEILDYIMETVHPKTLQFLHDVAEYAGFESHLSDFLQQLANYQTRYALQFRATNRILYDNPTYVENSPIKSEDPTLDSIFDANGYFASSFDNYEVRTGQIDMSHHVMNSLLRDEYLLVEAGTGVGKSLAYLIPAIKFANSSGERVVISTNTKNLQEQLFHKDLPSIKKNLPLSFRAVLVKGRENYICRKKWSDIAVDYTTTLSTIEAKALINLIVWAETTESGDISENSSFSRSEMNSLWKKIMADRHFCGGRKCSHYTSCHVMLLRNRIESSNLIIVNHSLLLADIMNKRATLGEYHYLIIDEAHNMINSASSHLGTSISYADMNNLLSALLVVRKGYQYGILTQLKAAAMKSHFHIKESFILQIDALIQILEDTQEKIPLLFNEIGTLVESKGNYNKLRRKAEDSFKRIDELIEDLIQYVDMLHEKVSSLRENLSTVNSSNFVEHDKHLLSIEGIRDQLHEQSQALGLFLLVDYSTTTLWYSLLNVSDSAYPKGVMNLAPIVVDRILHDLFYKEIRSIVFTSATLAIRGSFKYFTRELGIDLITDRTVNQQIVQSPFNYDIQSKIVVASYLPKTDDRFFAPQAIDLIHDIVEKTRLGTLVLFTSYKDLNAAYDTLADPFYQKDILLLSQGKSSSRSSILHQFKDDGKAVLLGTSSFWEGIDVQGESLSLLIVYKLPFQVPTDPIVEAYIEKLESEGKDSFMHYMMPTALLKLRQGYGRLIRSKTDKGIMVILDNRVITKRYGQYFIEILPTHVQNATSPIEVHDIIAKTFITI